MRRSELATARTWALCAAACVLLAGCFDARPGAHVGGETHFMQECDGDCAGDLACVCGVCTRSCDGDAACAELGAGARCMAVDRQAQACAATNGTQAGALAAMPERACAVGCEADGECSDLGAAFVCAGGVCQEAASASMPAVFVREPDAGTAPDGGAVAGPCSGEACAVAAQPLVLLVVDTSGSMERKANCQCTSPGCVECLPDCAAGERNRWIETIEVLGGTLDGYRCESLERTEANGATFDVGYYTPHHAPRGTPGDDGVLDVYRDRLRFGLATFDGMDTYAGVVANVVEADFDLDKSGGVEGLWSYNPIRALSVPLYTEQGGLVGSFHYPGCAAVSYYMDTGVRGPEAEQGALVLAGASDRLAVNDRIQAELLVTRPFGGTPIASALDDLYYYLAHDPRAAEERARASAKHVVLISDGHPDADHRSNHGCDCAITGDPNDPARCGGDPQDPRYDPALMNCPYPTAEQAARALRCGRAADCDGPVDAVHVIGYAVGDPGIRERLQQIALAGGSARGARFASSSAELFGQLSALLSEIGAP